MTADHVTIPLRRLDPGLPLPTIQRPGDAGADLPLAADVVIAPGQRVLVGTGMAIALPEGYVGLVHPRSGLAARLGLTIVNAPGTIDSGYRGEIKVCLLNTDAEHTIRLYRGDRIAQLVIQQYSIPIFVEVDELEASERGERGHGSTDVPRSGQDGPDDVKER